MSFQRYQHYKATDLDWPGEVPVHWEMKRLKRNLKLLTEKTSRRSNPIALENIESWSGRFVQTEAIFEGEGIAFERGDILFGKLRPYLAKAYVAENAGEAVGDFHVMRPINGIDSRFAQFQVLNREFIAIVDGSTFGAKMPRVSWDFMGNVVLAIPPTQEQLAIVAFLNCETAKIDALVAEEQRLIELLKEKRRAIISHAVTRGLNPDVPMKDSGTEWLGSVPRHWEVKAVRNVANVVRGASPRPAGDPLYFGGSAVPWVTVAEITKDELVYLTETETFLTEEGANRSNLFKKGTLIYSNSGATLGVPKLLGIDGCANDGVIAFEGLSSTVHPHFLYHFLASITDAIREKIRQGSGQPNLNTDIVKALRFGLPPLDEQGLIVRHIAELTDRFRSLIAEAELGTSLLQERRAALVAAAVSGQIDVRGLVKFRPQEEAAE